MSPFVTRAREAETAFSPLSPSFSDFFSPARVTGSDKCPDTPPPATPASAAIFNLRWTKLGLSQHAFARRFGIPYATVQNIEQGRRGIAPLARVVLAAIELDPDLMARAAAAVRAAGSHVNEEE